jgi:hypothetical protein
MILNSNLYKNRELEWNVKDKEVGSREMDAGCAVLNAPDAGLRNLIHRFSGLHGLL